MPSKRLPRLGTERMPDTPPRSRGSGPRTAQSDRSDRSFRSHQSAPPAPGAVHAPEIWSPSPNLPMLSPRSPGSAGSSARSPRSSRGVSPRSPHSPHSGRTFSRHVGDAGDKSSSKRYDAPDSPRKRTTNCIKPPSRHQLGRYAQSPKYATRTELYMGRLEGDRPHPSFDVDGDGTVSSYDYRLAKLFDADGNGILDEEETKTLREMMAKEKTEAIASMLKATNTRNPDFEKLRKQMVAPPPKEQEHIDGDEAMLMRNAFNAVDSDQSGKIGHEELQKLSVALNVPMSSDEVTQMMKEIDIDDSGEVDFGEFRHYWVQSKKGVAGDVSMFAGIDLGSDEFRIKIDRLAAQARKLNGAYNSQGAVAVMDQSAAINPNVVLPDKIYGERLTKAQYFGTSPPGGSRTSSRATATSGSASGSESPELYQKGTNIFRLVSDKIESKTNNVAKLFRQFDENKDGTVDYRELRVGLANMNVEMTDKEFDHLVELIDEDGDGEIDYQEFANADVMGSRLFKARQISGNSGCTSQSQLAGARFKKNREFADYKISKRYDSYMLGGREGYFGKAPELDQSMVMNGGDEDGDGVVDDFEAMHIREMMSKKKLDKEALVATRTPWAVGYPDDPRTIMTARFQHFVRR